MIDAHQHFWVYDASRHGWISDEMSAIRKDFMPPTLEALYKQNNVDGCVAVQVDQAESENDFLLDLARRHKFIKGIVGWVDLRAANVQQRLEYYSHERSLKGFRHIVQGETDPEFLLNKNFLNGISYLQKYGFTYDVLVYAHQLPQVNKFLKATAPQPFILDHIAKPDIKAREIVKWSKEIREVAKHEHVLCKLSGMVTEAHFKSWKFEDLEPYMNVVLEAFGPKRIVYGSDWPVCLVAASYEQQLGVVRKFISKLSPDEQSKILGENAIRFYHL